MQRWTVMVVSCLLCDILCVIAAPSLDEFDSLDIGYFWQVTDIHYDENYTLHGDPNSMCHSSASTIHYDLGEYGNYLCDSPWRLVESAIGAMAEIDPVPDFILWTGDSVPHVMSQMYSRGKVFNIIENVTDELTSKFLNTTILPSFGNHDPYPTNQMPTADESYYTSILNASHWDRLLNADVTKSFVKGGYYSYDVSSTIKVLCLNTALYYSSNNITAAGSDDPANQFAWMVDQLEAARMMKQKVYITGHVPPGVFELYPTIKWFHDNLNSKYLDITDKYSDVIMAHFYGHEHTDSLRSFDGPEGLSAMFLSPAVTPWKSSIPGVGSNNPSIRRYQYNRSSATVLDYQQFYLNLTSANSGDVKWQEEYKFREAFDVVDLHPQSVLLAAEKIISGDRKYLDRYLRYNSVSAKPGRPCNDTCLLMHKCSILRLQYADVTQCLNDKHHKHTLKPVTTESPKHRHHRDFELSLIWLMIIISVLLFLIILVLMVLCFRPNRNMVVGRGRSGILGYGSYNGYSSLTVSS